VIQKRTIPPAPSGWNKTIADLTTEAKIQQRSVSIEEYEWAREYERSLLPPDTRFPRKGDIYEAVDDVEVFFLTTWAAPFTGGEEGTLLRGEKISIPDEPRDSHPIAMHALAVDYEGVERRVIPESDRTNPEYNGFYIVVSTSDLNTKFRLVDYVNR
jgi:hypothetical protein